MAPIPEHQARERIDTLLQQAGWVVCDAQQVNLQANIGVAIREFPLNMGYGGTNYFFTSAMPRIAVTVGEADNGEHPVDVRPTKRACHGRRALGFRADQNARAKKHAHAESLGRIAA